MYIDSAYPKAILTLPMAKSPTYIHYKEEYMFAFQIVALEKPKKNIFSKNLAQVLTMEK